MPMPWLLTLIFFATFALIVAGLYLFSPRLEAADAGGLGEGATGAGASGSGSNGAGANIGRATSAGPWSEMSSDPSAFPVLLKSEKVSSISFWAALLERFEFSGNITRLVAEAGLTWSVGRCTALMLMCGASMAVVLTRVSWVPALAVILGGLVATSAPVFYIRHKRERRFAEFELHFPDALDSLGRAMRAGHAFSAGMEMVAHESLPPVSVEIRKTLEEWRLGQSWDEALEHLAARVPLTCVSLFVASVRIQSKAGGKLHEVLGRISEGVREAGALDGEVRAISAHGKLTGLILTLLPLGIAAMLHFAAPGHLDILTEHPVGRLMIVGALVLLVAAHFVMRRILDIRI